MPIPMVVCYHCHDYSYLSPLDHGFWLCLDGTGKLESLPQSAHNFGVTLLFAQVGCWGTWKCKGNTHYVFVSLELHSALHTQLPIRVHALSTHEFSGALQLWALCAPTPLPPLHLTKWHHFCFIWVFTLHGIRPSLRIVCVLYVRPPNESDKSPTRTLPIHLEPGLGGIFSFSSYYSFDNLLFTLHQHALLVLIQYVCHLRHVRMNRIPLWKQSTRNNTKSFQWKEML